MKWAKVYCFGGENGRNDEDDFVVRYKSDTGRTIEVEYGFSNRWYTVNGVRYEKLAEAKEAAEFDVDCQVSSDKVLKAFTTLNTLYRLADDEVKYGKRGYWSGKAQGATDILEMFGLADAYRQWSESKDNK